MKVLVGCEESQAVCSAFREIDVEAYSCDIQKCSGGHAEWHICGDVFDAIRSGFKKTEKGNTIYIDKWDLLIAHPPCTFLTNAATRSHSLRATPLYKINERTYKRIEAEKFFMDLVSANVDKIAIENPVGVMNTVYRKPDQIINPYEFSEGASDIENFVTKKTCLWLKNLKNLVPTYYGEKPDNAKLFGISPTGKAYCWEERVKHTSLIRSKTFLGIAKAMAEQWSKNTGDNDNQKEVKPIVLDMESAEAEQ